MPFTKRFPRMVGWLAAAVLLAVAIAVISPQQLPVALYKLSLISLAAVVAYWLDRCLFPYARPDAYLRRDWRHGTDERKGLTMAVAILMDKLNGKRQAGACRTA